MITKCDIDSDDLNIADIIWGPAESVLQGKTKTKKPNKHNRIPKLTLPILVSKQHKIITMYIDMFVPQAHSIWCKNCRHYVR